MSQLKIAKPEILSKLIYIIVITLAFQIVLSSAVFADPPTADLSLPSNIVTYYGGRAATFDICSPAGSTSVESIDLDAVVTNGALDKFVLYPSGTTNPTTAGTINPTTGIWTGLLEGEQCIGIAIISNYTGNLGEQFSIEVTIASSTLEGGANNDGDVLNNNVGTTIATTIAMVSDLKISTRLDTAGPISAGSPVRYVVTISNIGNGPVTANAGINLGFLVPSIANFVDVVDDNSLDGLSFGSCNQIPGGAGGISAGMSQYPGDLQVCSLTNTAELAPGTSFNFIFNMTATAGFASGNTSIHTLVIGDDLDSLEFQIAITLNLDGFAVETNNIGLLTYNTDALTATINRCVGQNATTTDGTGCFNVTFNKLIYADSFEQSDLVLTGGGSVIGFTQIDEFMWQVDVAGITPGSTLALTLGIDSVKDFSAIQNSAQVLGENTIRFAADDIVTTTPSTTPLASAQGSTSANGTLAETGFSSDQTWLALTIMLIGLGLVFGASKVRSRV